MTQLKRKSATTNADASVQVKQIVLEFAAPVVIGPHAQLALYEWFEGVVRDRVNQFHGHFHNAEWSGDVNGDGVMHVTSRLAQKRVCRECGANYGGRHNGLCTATGRVEYDQTIQEPA